MLYRRESTRSVLHKRSGPKYTEKNRIRNFSLLQPNSGVVLSQRYTCRSVIIMG